MLTIPVKKFLAVSGSGHLDCDALQWCGHNPEDHDLILIAVKRQILHQVLDSHDRG